MPIDRTRKQNNGYCYQRLNGFGRKFRVESNGT